MQRYRRRISSDAENVPENAPQAVRVGHSPIADGDGVDAAAHALSEDVMDEILNEIAPVQQGPLPHIAAVGQSVYPPVPATTAPREKA